MGGARRRRRKATGSSTRCSPRLASASVSRCVPLFFHGRLALEFLEDALDLGQVHLPRHERHGLLAGGRVNVIHVGETEEEEGDRILDEVLAEIGVSVGQQVRSPLLRLALEFLEDALDLGQVHLPRHERHGLLAGGRVNMEDDVGETEEEEGDRILDEVLAEIGVSVGQQVRSWTTRARILGGCAGSGAGSSAAT
jgi:hypothetical protein